ncbi:MAG: 2Fe-2S iron-sulfur cluster-binding protein, partial [Candidatus Omnitrophica bacterium]|nr:2Fe-2S iron-sulfur cluster-binding protein [Candidatus Omnitrophota bacterium]
MNRYIVTFRPDNRKVEVDRDTTLLQAALRCGVYLYSACGGDGVCGRCR